MSSQKGVRRGVAPKTIFNYRPYIIKKDEKGGEGKKLPILRRHGLLTAPEYVQLKGKTLPDKKIFTTNSNETA